MQNNLDRFLKTLEAELKQIELDNSDIIKKSEKSVHCINQCLKELKEYISKNNFPIQNEEVQFL